MSGRLSVARILEDHPDIDAVFAASDLMALGVIAALRQAGRRIPEDVAVAGFDDSAAAAMAEPPLTTMHNPLAESAVEAVNILDDLMSGRSGPRPVSYTHLDVYKRQVPFRISRSRRNSSKKASLLNRR